MRVSGNHRDKILEGYETDSGEFIKSEFTFISLGMIIYNELAIQLGADLDARGFVTTDDKGESSVSGLFVRATFEQMLKNKFTLHGIMPLILWIKSIHFFAIKSVKAFFKAQIYFLANCKKPIS